MKRVAKRLLSPEIGEIPTAPQHADREMYEFFVDWRKNIGRRADNSKFFLEGLTYLGKHNPDKRGADNEKWIGDLLGIDMSSINVEKMNHSYPGKKDPSMSSSRYGVRYENDIRLLRNPFWTLKLEVFVQNYDPQTDDCINDINAIIRTKANPDSSWPGTKVHSCNYYSNCFNYVNRCGIICGHNIDRTRSEWHLFAWSDFETYCGAGATYARYGDSDAYEFFGSSVFRY